MGHDRVKGKRGKALSCLKYVVFESQNHMNIVTNRFKTVLKQKTVRLSILSFVFYCFVNFLCISLFLRLMYFIVFYLELFKY